VISCGRGHKNFFFLEQASQEINLDQYFINTVLLMVITFSASQEIVSDLVLLPEIKKLVLLKLVFSRVATRE